MSYEDNTATKFLALRKSCFAAEICRTLSRLRTLWIHYQLNGITLSRCGICMNHFRRNEQSMTHVCSGTKSGEEKGSFKKKIIAIILITQCGHHYVSESSCLLSRNRFLCPRVLLMSMLLWEWTVWIHICQIRLQKTQVTFAWTIQMRVCLMRNSTNPVKTLSWRSAQVLANHPVASLCFTGSVLIDFEHICFLLAVPWTSVFETKHKWSVQRHIRVCHRSHPELH